MATLTIDVESKDGFKKSSTVPVESFAVAAYNVAKTMEALCELEEMGLPQHLDTEYHLRLMAWTFEEGEVNRSISLKRTDGSVDTWSYLV
jgi:hypothetical protein